MSNRKLIFLLVLLIFAATALLPGMDPQNTSREQQEEKQAALRGVENVGVDIDLEALRRNLENLRKVDWSSIHQALTDLPARLTRIQAALEVLPSRLELIETKLENFPQVMEKVERELELLPMRMKGLEKEIHKLENLNLEKMIENALESLEGLDAEIEKSGQKKASPESDSAEKEIGRSRPVSPHS